MTSQCSLKIQEISSGGDTRERYGDIWEGIGFEWFI